jgi:GNAT superfamily N-acetyltransferase
VSSRSDIEIVDVTDVTTFGRLPACADPRFDHRSCDYWEDDVRGAKTARPAWWQAGARPTRPRPQPRSDNPFAPPPKAADDFNPFASAPDSSPEVSSDGDDLFDVPGVNPFAPAPQADASDVAAGAPRKLRLLDRGHVVFGSYAKVLMLADEPAVYAQFGPLSAYPRAQHIRELYPRLPQAPLPAVITCIATASEARGQGFARKLIDAIVKDLAGRGFSAIEAYPDLTLSRDEASAASPAFWEGCGFDLVAQDERYPVMRRELD